MSPLAAAPSVPSARSAPSAQSAPSAPRAPPAPSAFCALRAVNKSMGNRREQTRMKTLLHAQQNRWSPAYSQVVRMVRMERMVRMVRQTRIPLAMDTNIACLGDSLGCSTCGGSRTPNPWASVAQPHLPAVVLLRPFQVTTPYKQGGGRSHKRG